MRNIDKVKHALCRPTDIFLFLIPAITKSTRPINGTKQGTAINNNANPVVGSAWNIAIIPIRPYSKVVQASDNLKLLWGFNMNPTRAVTAPTTRQMISPTGSMPQPGQNKR